MITLHLACNNALWVLMSMREFGMNGTVLYGPRNGVKTPGVRVEGLSKSDAVKLAKNLGVRSYQIEGDEA